MAAVGWLSLAQLGALFFIVPRLTGVKLYSERLGNITVWGWNLTMVIGVVCFALGYTEGREYAELIAPLDILIVVLFAMTIYNVLRTIQLRRERQLYVSLWYFMGSLFWTTFVWIVGNRTFVPLSGLNDSIVNWFFGHNILGLWFTTMGVGVAYYLIPKITRAPLYSHTLSMLGFATIATFYAPTGTHHLLQAPVPEWLKSIAVISSVLLLVPVSTVLVNFAMTMRGYWGLAARDVTLRFVVTAGFMYLFTCVQGPFQATRWVNWYLHYTQWVVAHAHLALLGTFTWWMVALVYYALPRILHREMYSRALMEWHYWLSVIGFGIFFSGLTIAGLVQSAGWAAGIPIQKVVLDIFPHWVFRAIGGLMMLTGQVIFAYNVYRTATTREAAVIREAAAVVAKA
jgi:cbb3-type cytochrome c oxidase subunit I